MPCLQHGELWLNDSRMSSIFRDTSSGNTPDSGESGCVVATARGAMLLSRTDAAAQKFVRDGENIVDFGVRARTHTHSRSEGRERLGTGHLPVRVPLGRPAGSASPYRLCDYRFPRHPPTGLTSSGQQSGSELHVPAGRQQPVGCGLGAVERLGEREAGFDGEPLAGDVLHRQKQVDAEQQVEPPAAVEVGAVCGDEELVQAQVGAADVSPELAVEAHRRADVVSPFAGEPGSQVDAIAEFVVEMAESQANRSQGLRAPRPVRRLAAVCQPGAQVVGARTGAHPVRAVGRIERRGDAVGRQHAGRKAHPEIQVNLAAVVPMQHIQRLRADITRIGRRAGGRNARGADVGHLNVVIGEHPQNGEILRRGVLDQRSMLLNGGVRRRQCETAERLRRRDGAGAVVQITETDDAVPVGGEEAPHVERVVAVDSHGRQSVGTKQVDSRQTGQRQIIGLLGVGDRRAKLLGPFRLNDAVGNAHERVFCGRVGLGDHPRPAPVAPAGLRCNTRRFLGLRADRAGEKGERGNPRSSAHGA
jgi:hypothetical protein